MSHTLDSLARLFFLERQVCNKYRSAVTKVTRQLSEFLERPATTDDFVRDALNQWLLSLEESHAPRTIRTKRVILGTLWRFAFDRGLAGPAMRLRVCKVPQCDPEALTACEVAALLKHIDTLKGCFQRTRVSRRLYFASIYNAYYDSALRLSDLRSIEVGWIEGGHVSLVQSKTNRTHTIKFRAETMKLIREHLAGRKTGLIWGTLTEKNFGNWQRKLFRAAGIRGTGKWIRRSSASYVELHHPGMGWRHLGHARPGLAEQFYIDPKIVRREPTLPPRLTG